MPAVLLLVAVVLAGAAVGGYFVFRPQRLLRWYVREVRAESGAQEPGEAIVAYPLA